jgi:hypothetical protein
MESYSKSRHKRLEKALQTSPGLGLCSFPLQDGENHQEEAGAIHREHNVWTDPGYEQAT